MLLYTANIGEYDQVQVTAQPGFDFLVLQNKSNKIPGLSDVKAARYHKLFPPQLSKVTVWLDANIKINCDLKSFVNKWLTDDIDMVVMEHGRHCIYDEMDACIKRKKDTIKNIKRQKQFYLKQGFPKNAGMIGSGILIRKTYDIKINWITKYWWDVIREFSHRDQLAFNYALWKSKLNPKLAYIPYSVFGNEFELIPHEKKNKKK